MSRILTVVGIIIFILSFVARGACAQITGGTFELVSPTLAPVSEAMSSGGGFSLTSVVPVSGGNFQTGSAASTTTSGGGGGGVLPALSGGSSTPVTPSPTLPPGTLVSAPKSIYNVRIMFITDTTANITFDSTVPGVTAIQYTAGKLSGSSGMSKDLDYAHSHTLVNLTPSTKYTFNIFVQWNDGTNTTFTHDTYNFTTSKKTVVTPKPSTSSTGTDTVVTPEKVVPTPIVVNLEAETKDESTVHLTWTNPANKSAYKEVVLVRSTEGFVQIPTAGTVVYRGLGEGFDDAGLDTSRDYYYTLFVVDAKGKVLASSPVKSIPLALQEEIKNTPINAAPGTVTQQAPAGEEGCRVRGHWAFSILGLIIAFLSGVWWRRSLKHIHEYVDQLNNLPPSSTPPAIAPSTTVSPTVTPTTTPPKFDDTI